MPMATRPPGPDASVSEPTKLAPATRAVVRDWVERVAGSTEIDGRWVAGLCLLAAVLLVPWVVLLLLVLPSSHRAAHWDVAWAGFDIVLAVLLVTVAVTYWRRSTWLEGAATAAATLMLADIWFDLITSSTRTELVVAAVEAVFVELPLAALCLLLARSAQARLATRRAGD